MPQSDHAAASVRRSPNILVLFKYCSNTEIFLFVLACLCAFIHGASRPALSYLFGAILQTVGTSPNDFMREIETLSISMVVLSGIVWVVGTAWFYIFMRIAIAVSQRVQRAYLAAVLSKDIAWFDACTPAEIPTRLSSDIEKIQGAIANKAGNLVMNLSQTVCGLCLGFIKGWQIALVCCGCVPVLVLSRALMAKSMKKSAIMSQELYAKAGAVAEEVLFGIRTVAAFGGEPRESERYTRLLSEGRKKSVKVAIQVGFITSLTLGSMFAVYALALFVGGLLIDREVYNSATDAVYNGGDVYVVLSSVIMSAFALGSIGPSISAITEGSAALEGLYRTIEERSAIEQSLVMREGKKSCLIAKEIKTAKSEIVRANFRVEFIEFDQVVFKYPSRPEVVAVDSVSLRFEAGRKIAIVGESGSGKSTLISLLERFYDPISGSVLMNGIDIKTMDPRTLRSLFGYVGQEPVMFATTIRSNLTYGKPEPVDDAKIFESLRRANVYDFVLSLPEGLETYCGPGGSQMSGGQKQRIAIARALLREPQILLLDEATSALDNESEKLVQRTIDELVESRLTTIWIAHRLSTVRNCDVIFVLKRGGILVEKGSHNELMRLNGHYKSLVSSQENTGPVPIDVLPTRSIPLLSQVEDNSKNISPSRVKKIEVKSEEQREKERILEISKTYSVPWKRLLKFVNRKDGWLYITGCLGALGKGASFPVHALLLSSVVAFYYLPDSSEMLQKVSLASVGYAGLAVGVFFTVFLNYWSFAHIGESFTMQLRSDSFRHILSQDMSFFDHPENAPAKLIVCLSSWAGKMNVLAGSIFGVFIEFFASLIAGLTISFVASPKLTGILIGTLPLLVVAMIVMSSVIWQGKRTDEVSSKQAALVASEAVQNMRTIRALIAEVSALELYEFYANQRVMEESKNSFKSAFVFGTSMMVAFLPYALGFYIGGLFVNDGSLSMQDMMQALLGLILTSVGAGQALAYLPDIKAAKAASHDIFKLLDTESKVNPFQRKNASRGEVCGDITFSNVSFAYPQRSEIKILKNLSFSVKSGQKVALVGPSGSGKSSILALLQRFYDPQEGRIYIGGANIREMDVCDLRSAIGFVGQEPILFETTFQNNVSYGKANGLSATRTELERVKELAKLDFVSPENIHWDTVLGPKGSLLSGGQKQRTAIARAMIRDPKILLLDEATSALDSASEKIVQTAIDEATVGRTTFVIAHRLSTIQDADVILVISSGCLVESGTHNELMTKAGLYCQLYNRGTL